MYLLCWVSALSSTLCNPTGLQPARLPVHGDFPGKNPGDVHCRVSAGNKAPDLQRAGSSSCPPGPRLPWGKWQLNLFMRKQKLCSQAAPAQPCYSVNKMQPLLASYLAGLTATRGSQVYSSQERWLSGGCRVLSSFDHRNYIPDLTTGA